MATDINTLLIQMLLQKQQPQLFTNDENCMRSQLNSIIQNQLIQTIIEEKLKNQILKNALLLRSQLEEINLRNGNKQVNEDIKNKQIQEIAKLEPQVSIESQEKHSTQLEEDKKIKLFNRRIVRNQTKNIPKNYGKAIVTFIEKNQRTVKRVLMHCGLDYPEFMVTLKHRKKNLNSIADLRSLWVEEEYKFAKPTRILSLIFLKKHSLPYIFHSRVTNYKGHIKYRYRLIEALQNPKMFTCIKVF